MNHVNGFVLTTLQRAEIMKSQSTLLKAFRDCIEKTARGLLSVFERLIESRIMKSVKCVIKFFFVIAADLFSPVITFKVFACNFWEFKFTFLV